MKFKSEEERLKHPHAGKIPIELWTGYGYFKREIDETNLHFFITPIDTLLKEPDRYLTANERRCALIALFIQSESKNLDSIFDYAKKHLQLSWGDIFNCMFEFKNESMVTAIRDYIQNSSSVINKKAVFMEAVIYAGIYGHLGLLQWIDKKYPGLIVEVNKSYNKVLYLAASYGDLDMLKWLNALDKNMSVKNFDSSINNPMDAIFEKGKLDMLKWLKEEAPEVVDYWLIYLENWFLRNTARNGHFDMFQWVTEQNPERLKKVMQEREYEVFSEGAFSGNLDILELIIKKLPDLTDEMLAADKFRAFRFAALYSPLTVLMWFAQLRPKLLVDMIKADNYKAFRNACSRNSNIDVVEWFVKQVPEELFIEMVKAEQFEAFRESPMQTMQLLQKLAPKLTVEMIRANNFEVFQRAIRRGDLDVLNWFTKLVPDLIVEMIQYNNYESFLNATEQAQPEVMQWLFDQAPKFKMELIYSYYNRSYYSGDAYSKEHNLEVLQWLKKQDPELFELAMGSKIYNHFQHAICDSLHSNVVFFLLNSPTFFNITAGNMSSRTYTYDYVVAFVKTKLDELHLKEQVFKLTHPNDKFDIKEIQEAKLYSYILRCLNNHSLPISNTEIKFLSYIPAIDILGNTLPSAPKSWELPTFEEIMSKRSINLQNIQKLVEGMPSQIGIFQRTKESPQEKDSQIHTLKL